MHGRGYALAPRPGPRLCPVATIKDEALCVRHWDWSETSQTVSLFTREHGLIRALAKGARREKSPFSGGLELLTRGEVVAITRSSGAMATLVSWDLLESFTAARRSLPAFHVGSYLIDLLHHAVTDEDPHPELYDRLVGSLRGLACSPDWALLEGQWAVLLETGHRPQVLADVRTGEVLGGSAPVAFSPGLGGLVLPGERPAPGGEAWRVRPATARLLADLARGVAYREASDPDAVVRAGRLLAAYLRHVLGRELHSVSALFGPEGLPM